MKRICRYLPVFALLLLSVPFASAQSSVDFNFGLGTAHDKSTGLGIDNLNSANAFGACTVGAADPNCQATPSLSGVFMAIGGDAMLTKRYGFGAEVSLQPNHPDYGPLQYREIFYDFNGIFAPVNEKKAMVQIQGGIGGAKTSFIFAQNQCVGTAVCSNYNQPVGSSNHFQVHAGVGIQVYVTEHMFIRPEFDYHYVPGLTDQFGSNSVPAAMVWVGYTLGDR